MRGVCRSSPIIVEQGVGAAAAAIAGHDDHQDAHKVIICRAFRAKRAYQLRLNLFYEIVIDCNIYFHF